MGCGHSKREYGDDAGLARSSTSTSTPPDTPVASAREPQGRPVRERRQSRRQGHDFGNLSPPPRSERRQQQDGCARLSNAFSLSNLVSGSRTPPPRRLPTPPRRSFQGFIPTRFRPRESQATPLPVYPQARQLGAHPVGSRPGRSPSASPTRQAAEPLLRAATPMIGLPIQRSPRGSPSSSFTGVPPQSSGHQRSGSGGTAYSAGLSSQVAEPHVGAAMPMIGRSTQRSQRGSPPSSIARSSPDSSIHRRAEGPGSRATASTVAASQHPSPQKEAVGLRSGASTPAFGRPIKNSQRGSPSSSHGTSRSSSPYKQAEGSGSWTTASTPPSSPSNSPPKQAARAGSRAAPVTAASPTPASATPAVSPFQTEESQPEQAAGVDTKSTWPTLTPVLLVGPVLVTAPTFAPAPSDSATGSGFATASSRSLDPQPQSQQQQQQQCQGGAFAFQTWKDESKKSKQK